MHVNVGVAYHGAGKLDDAIRHYCLALELDPQIAVARENIEVALDEQDKLDAVLEELMRSPAKAVQGAAALVLVEYDVRANRLSAGVTRGGAAVATGDSGLSSPLRDEASCSTGRRAGTLSSPRACRSELVGTSTLWAIELVELRPP